MPLSRAIAILRIRCHNDTVGPRVEHRSAGARIALLSGAAAIRAGCVTAGGMEGSIGVMTVSATSMVAVSDRPADLCAAAPATATPPPGRARPPRAMALHERFTAASRAELATAVSSADDTTTNWGFIQRGPTAQHGDAGGMAEGKGCDPNDLLPELLQQPQTGRGPEGLRQSDGQIRQQPTESGGARPQSWSRRCGPGRPNCLLMSSMPRSTL